MIRSGLLILEIKAIKEAWEIISEDTRIKTNCGSKTIHAADGIRFL